jgi:hypothetical protein
MRHARLLVLLPALVALGCPGGEEEPLGPVRGGRIDTTLVGDWWCHDRSGRENVRLTLVPFDRNQYVLVLSDPGQRKAPEAMRVLSTTLNGHDVMSIQSLGDTVRTDEWTYARMWSPEDGKLSVDLVRMESLEGVPEDVESRRLAIGDLFDSPELWEAGFGCVPFKDEEKNERVAP